MQNISRNLPKNTAISPEEWVITQTNLMRRPYKDRHNKMSH